MKSVQNTPGYRICTVSSDTAAQVLQVLSNAKLFCSEVVQMVQNAKPIVQVMHNTVI